MRKSLALITGTLSILAAACDGNRGPDGVTVRYELRLRDGGAVDADVQFRLPSGEMEREKVQTPWSSDPLRFEEGDLMVISAEIKDTVTSPLLCVLASEIQDQGDYVLASIDQPLTACETQYELGQWPPDDDDPIGNPLIRVG